MEFNTEKALKAHQKVHRDKPKRVPKTKKAEPGQTDKKGERVGQDGAALLWPDGKSKTFKSYLKRMRQSHPEIKKGDKLLAKEVRILLKHSKGLQTAIKGAKLEVGGVRPNIPGFFYPPTVLSNVPDDADCLSDEIFGPVACAIPFKTFDEVMNSANDTPFGLSAVLWTQNLSRALQFVEEIEAGFVQVNQCVAPRANVSYGGLKMSGLGKEYAFDSMINHFTQSKTVLINRGKSNIDI